MPTGPEEWECVAAIITAAPGMPGDLFDFRARIQSDGPRHEKRVDGHDDDLALSVVEHRRADLARIVEASVERLRVSAGTFHADPGRDIALRKSGFDGRRGFGGPKRRPT